MAAASRTFGVEDQARFAALTGDFNPMHMDSVAARRTHAGGPVVHGIHTLLWLLDTIATRHIELPNIATLKVRFRKMVYLGDRVDAKITQLTADTLRAQASIDGVEVVSLSAGFGSVLPESELPTPALAKLLLRQTAPCELKMQLSIIH